MLARYPDHRKRAEVVAVHRPQGAMGSEKSGVS